MRRRLTQRPALAAALLFLVLGLGLLGQVTVGGKVMSGNDRLFFEPPFSDAKPAGVMRESNPLTFDSVFVFHPDMLHARAALHHGRLPVWSDSIGAGQPMLAAQQGATLFPLNVPAMVLPFWRSLGWIALLKLLTAALGTYALCRALGLRAGPAMLGGIAYGFGMNLIVWLEHPHVNSYILIPWLLLAVRAVTVRAGPGPVAGLAAVVGMMLLGGHPQSAFIGLVAAACWALVLLTAPGPSLGARARTAGLLLAAVALGIAVAGIMLIPFAELSANSYLLSRSGPPAPRTFSIPFFFPEFWGRTDKYVVAGEPWNFTERTAYVGAIPLLLAATSLYRLHRASREQLFFFALAVVSFFVVTRGPIADLARDTPGLDSVGLARALILVALGISVCAAFGLQALLDGDRKVRRAALVLASLTALVPFAVVLKLSFSRRAFEQALGQFPMLERNLPAGILPDAVHLASALHWALFAFVFIALVLALPRVRPAARRAPVLIGAALVLTALDLIPLDHGYQPAIPLSVADAPAPAAVAPLTAVPLDQRVTGDLRLGANLALRFGFRDMRSHELPVIERRSRVFDGLGGVGFQRTEWVSSAPDAGAVLDVFGVSLVYAPAIWNQPDLPILTSGHLVPADGRPPTGKTVLWRNTRALPRAWVAYDWRTAKNFDGALPLVVGSTVDQLHRSPVIERTGPPQGSPRAPTAARITRDEDVDVRIEADAAAPGMLILHDTFYPGWKAYVDDKATPILPADGAFRAVALPAGRHEVRFAYAPRSVTAGALVSAFAILGVGFLGFAGWRRRSPRSPALSA